MNDALTVANHPTLARLRWRVRAAWLLTWLRPALLRACLGSTLAALGGKLLGQPEWAAVAAAWSALAVAAHALPALRRWPGTWETARAADALGLAERVTSALYAARVSHPATPMLAAQARRALADLDPSAYPVLPRPRPWLATLAGLGALALAALAPVPALTPGQDRAAEARAVATARAAVQAVQADLQPVPTVEPLARAAAEELEALDRQLAEARSVAEASRALEEAQERLATLAGAEEFAWRRAVERLVAAWSTQPGLGGLADALAARDPQAVQRALEQLAARAEAMSPEERRGLQLGLQAGANAARDAAELASALRQAADRLGADAEGPADEGDDAAEARRAIEELAAPLSRGAARAAGLQAVQGAIARLGEARAGLSSADGAAGAAAGGPPTGSASGGRAGAGGAGQQGAGGGSASGGSGGSGDGTSGAGAGGAGSGSGSGSSGSGAGSSGGQAGGGQGGGGQSGGGAGAGGGPARGQPGAGNAGPTGQSGTASPNNAGAAMYDPVYAPGFLGGEGGPRVEAPGDPAGAGGDTVELPESPLELGALRPYNEVYGAYEAAARQSLARQPLPPSLQGLVQRYFSAIAPSEPSPTE